MKLSWGVPFHWSAASTLGMSAILWDHVSNASNELNCALNKDYMIFSLHLSGFQFARVELDGQNRYADTLKRGSWMLVDAAKAPKAQTCGAFSLLHVYLPKWLLTETMAKYQFPEPSPETYQFMHGQFTDSSVAQSALALKKAAQNSGVIRELEIDRACYNLLVDIITLLHQPAKDQSIQRLSPDNKKRLEKYIAEHLNQPLDLETLAGTTGLSKYHFLRAFKEDYGQTPMAAIRERRLKAAYSLLIASNTPVTEIAHKLGFSDHSHLSSAFKSQFGQSPSKLRRSLVK